MTSTDEHHVVQAVRDFERAIKDYRSACNAIDVHSSIFVVATLGARGLEVASGETARSRLVTANTPVEAQARHCGPSGHQLLSRSSHRS